MFSLELIMYIGYVRAEKDGIEIRWSLYPNMFVFHEREVSTSFPLPPYDPILFLSLSLWLTLVLMNVYGLVSLGKSGNGRCPTLLSAWTAQAKFV